MMVKLRRMISRLRESGLLLFSRCKHILTCKIGSSDHLNQSTCPSLVGNRGRGRIRILPHLAFDMLFDYRRELLLDLLAPIPNLALHVWSSSMRSSSDAAPAQMPLGGALQQLAIVVTLPVAPEATPSQFPNATQSYGWLREMKRAHSKLCGNSSPSPLQLFTTSPTVP